ncbi:MAG: MmgE/PrpD family protein [Candidatus Pacebacteria bacterium]|nr:MmgE/PrpD family protein [Candidatus Paceibacterota bacterium]
MTLTRILAELALNTRTDELPASTYAAARKMVLDSLGCAIAGYNSDGIAACLEAAREQGGATQATVLVHGDRLPMDEAAFVNGAMIHALDYDDVHLPGPLHLMSSMLPVALAASEYVRADGRAFLDAIILGVEVSARLGRACRPLASPAHQAGFLQSSIIGGFGATAGACRILGMSVEQTVAALGLFYAQASGNRQALYDKTLTKRLQPAFAARDALWAADLARRGITGPERAIEGSAGLVRLYLNSDGAIPPEVLSERFGRWEIEELSVKQFTSCGACHPVARAALDLAEEEDLAPADIDRVSIYVGEGRNELVGMPFEMGDSPQVNAQFCATYSAALALLRRRAGLAEFTSERVVEDTEVADFARRIKVLTHHDQPPPDTPCPRGINAWACKPHGVFVETRDGRKLERWRTPLSVLGPDAMDWDTVVDKFKECTTFSGICPPEQARQIIAAVESLGETSGVSGLLEACRQVLWNPQ